MLIPWHQQRERVGRWLERVRRIHAGEATGPTTKELEDDVRAFFIECSHLGDYVRKGKNRICSRADVYAWRKSHPALETCRQLCNGIKHVRLPALHQQAILVGVNDGTSGARHDSTHGVRMVIQPSGEDALEIAEQAVADWDELIRTHTNP